jgi:intraflagellar transport protein 74
MNQELDSLNSRKAVLDDEVAVSAVKKEALALYDNLREIEKKRDDLINEEKNRGTPAQERERLLNQVCRKEKERERETHTDKPTDGQRDRERQRNRDRQTDRQIDRQTARNKERKKTNQFDKMFDIVQLRSRTIMPRSPPWSSRSPKSRIT